jgi:hydrogenase maturation factor HypF (carbamoyltransferase family)
VEIVHLRVPADHDHVRFGGISRHRLAHPPRDNTPLTSSAGRLFDAVAAIPAIRDETNYEG